MFHKSSKFAIEVAEGEFSFPNPKSGLASCKPARSIHPTQKPLFVLDDVR